VRTDGGKSDALSSKEGGIQRNEGEDSRGSGGEVHENGSDHCGGCGKEVSGEHRAVRCDSCGLWHHNQCENIGEDVYEFLTKHGDNDSIQWHCKKCVILYKKVIKSVRLIEEAQRQLQERVDKVQSSLENKLEMIMDKLRLDDKIPVVVQDCVEKAMDIKIQEDKDEELERQKRKTSVIMHGVSESSAEESDQREQDDLGQIAAMMHEISCDDVKVSKIIRLGKRPSADSKDEAVRPRPLKLILDTEENKIQVLKAAKNLRLQKERGWERVFIHQDLTPKERELRKPLVQELKSRRAQGETDLIIYNGKVMKKRTHEY
jgi:hypothetical protein